MASSEVDDLAKRLHDAAKLGGASHHLLDEVANSDPRVTLTEPIQQQNNADGGRSGPGSPSRRTGSPAPHTTRSARVA